MSTILNAGAEARVVKGYGKRPVVAGNIEMTFPPRMITLPSREPVQVDEASASAIIERWGRSGIVELQVGETLEAATLRGLQARHDCLVRILTEYREQQGARRAGGLEILLPREHHRKALKEVNAILKEMEKLDPVMSAALPPVTPEQIVDPVARELQSFGISAEMAPMTPGVDAGLLGIGG